MRPLAAVASPRLVIVTYRQREPAHQPEPACKNPQNQMQDVIDSVAMKFPLNVTSGTEKVCAFEHWGAPVEFPGKGTIPRLVNLCTCAIQISEALRNI